MTTSTIPYTPTTPGWTSTHPRPLGHIRPLDSTETPVLPVSPRPAVFHTTTHGSIYQLSTHLFPATHTRLTPDLPLPEIPTYTPGESRSARLDKVGVLVGQLLERQNKYFEGGLAGGPSERPLWNCVNRYVRTAGPAVVPVGITLFLAHANGLHKETWEPMLRSLLDAPGGEFVDEVWAWESVQHGDAAIINAKNENGIYDWLDNSRDIANFLLHYLPDEAGLSILPTRLPRLPASTADVRARDGYRTRKLVVVGHSFGGTTSLRVANDFPKLFSSFVLVDPVISRPFFRVGGVEPLIIGALTRRDRWSSREEALQLFKTSPFFAAWDSAVLQLYVDHALIDDPQGSVRLKMSGLQEGLSFVNRIPSWEVWELLEKIDEGITLRWVLPSSFSVFSGAPKNSVDEALIKQATCEKVWRRRANATNVVFHFAGHLIVQEAPLELARDISEFLLCEYGPLRPRL